METHCRRSIFWPLLLITIGVVFLLNTLGIIPGNGWELFLKLWPLLFIIGGLDNIFQGRGYIWAVISLGLGTIFLLANFGYLALSSFTLLLRFWPLLLIAAGLDLIFRGRSPWAQVIGVILAIALVGGIVWFTATGVTVGNQQTTPIEQTLDNASRLSVQISNPTGRVEISKTSEGRNVAVQGKLTLAPRETIEKSYQVVGGSGRFEIHSSGEAFLPWTGGFKQPVWAFQLNNTVPLSLKVNTAAGEQDVDLRGFQVENLDLAVAVGKLEVTLPEKGIFSGKLDNPVGQMIVSIPAGALVEFQSNGVFVLKTIPSGFTVSGNRIYSPDANSQSATMHITVNQPIGQLILQSLP